MRARRETAKWPVVIGLAGVVTLALPFLVPRVWLPFLLPAPQVARTVPARSGRWLTLLPPPRIEIDLDSASLPTAADPSVPRPTAPDPRWWTAGVVVGGREDPALIAPTAPAINDTVRMLLAELGPGSDFLTRTRPDSVLAARLFLLRLHDGLRYDELKPMLRNLGRAEQYADIMARAAEMYDEPLAREIRVPD